VVRRVWGASKRAPFEVVEEWFLGCPRFNRILTLMDFKL